MRNLLNFAPTFLFSLSVHAAAAGLLVWNDFGTASSISSATETIEVEFTESSGHVPSRVVHNPRIQTKEVATTSTDLADISAKDSTAKNTSESAKGSSESTAENANETFDLGTLQSHPYFFRLRKLLSDANRGLLPYDGRPERFSIQIDIGGSGKVLDTRVVGEDSRLKAELTQRISRISFLPAIPEDLVADKDHIKVRYQVLFAYN